MSSTRTRLTQFCCIVAAWATVVAASFPGLAESSSTNFPTRSDRGFAFQRLEIPEGPWVVHLFRVDRGRNDLVFVAPLGDSNQLGMNLISDQVRMLPPGLGRPLAAVNGDFYQDEPDIPGDPRDLQIHLGELVSGPTGHACFWLDESGNPHSTNVLSRFRILRPDGRELPFGLNQARPDDEAVLYTSAAGSATPDRAGTELVLESAGEPGSAWLPLKAGQKLKARVREIRHSGKTPLDRQTLVLSVGPKLTVPVGTGGIIQVVTETLPELTGVTTAIGGGPMLVRDGKPREWSGFLLRHPRSAIAWNQQYIYLVEVDGRQTQSVGMTFPELAEYLVKLGCQNAMNLDGGGSATMWVFGQVMSSPSEGQERPSANSLVVLLRKPESQAGK